MVWAVSGIFGASVRAQEEPGGPAPLPEDMIDVKVVNHSCGDLTLLLHHDDGVAPEVLVPRNQSQAVIIPDGSRYLTLDLKGSCNTDLPARVEGQCGFVLRTISTAPRYERKDDLSKPYDRFNSSDRERARMTLTLGPRLFRSRTIEVTENVCEVVDGEEVCDVTCREL